MSLLTSAAIFSKRAIILAFIALAIPPSLRAKLNVIATTGDLGAIAREVGGDEVKVTVLARPTEDPHFVDAKPSFLVHMSRTDLLIEGGAELEAAWLSPLIDGSRNAKIQRGAPGHLMASQGIQLVEVPTALDRSQGDIHAAGNPHYLTDPVNARIVAGSIAKKLCELDPRACQKFEKNAQAFNARIDAKLKEWEQKLAPYKGQHIASYHNSWPYFAQRFGFVLDLFLEPKPGIPPTPAHLAEVIAAMQKEHVKVILCDPYLNRRTAEKVANDTGATVIDASQFPGGIKGVKDDYISLLDHLVNAVAAAMSK